jgi:hypothetical protein
MAKSALSKGAVLSVRIRGGVPGVFMKKDIVWKDLAGEGYTLDELIDEFKLNKVINRNFHALLSKYKIPFAEIDKASFLAKSEHYDWIITNKTADTSEQEIPINTKIIKTAKSKKSAKKVAAKKTTRRKK